MHFAAPLGLAPPEVLLSTGAKMPVLALGTGHSNSRGGLSTPKMLQLALSLGYDHIDTSEVYPNFRQIGPALQRGGYSRERYFLTTKIDVTAPIARQRRCCSNGTGCFDVVIDAMVTQLRTLRVDYVDMALLHRPPRCGGGGRRKSCDRPVQCTRLREQWRAMEAVHQAQQARAIGVSNYCVETLTCLLGTSKVKPAVLQQMHRLGMGADPFGYISWARSLGIHYMAYSVLGGADRKTAELFQSPIARGIATARGVSVAEVATRWVVELGLPLVLLSNKPSHLVSNLRLVRNTSLALTSDEMGRLSALTSPAGRPSTWGDCVDTHAPHPK